MGLIAIGDIHGCRKTFDALMDELAPATDDHLVFVGDYIDRGPDSKGVIDRMLEIRETYRCTFLRGNHERFMLDYLDDGTFNLWSANGGVSTVRSYTDGRAQLNIPDEHAEFVRSTELYYQTDDFFFVHAGLKPNLTIEENLDRFGEDVFLWERGHMKADSFAWEKPVVCGHTPQAEPINREKLLAIDTGCVYHMHPGLGRLTAVRLPERDFVSVKYTDG